MKTISEVSTVLRETLANTGMKQQDLRVSAGVSRQTLCNVLKGTEDFKLTTLLAVADKLGLEVLLVPRQVVALGPFATSTEEVVETLVGRLRKSLAATATLHKIGMKKA